MGWSGFGTLAEKLSTYIPGKVEKLKNEKERLLDERKILLGQKVPTAASIERLMAINTRVSKINALLGNKASD